MAADQLEIRTDCDREVRKRNELPEELKVVICSRSDEKRQASTIKGKPKIQRVPRVLRESLSSKHGCYKPVLVSIGPYHYNTKELQSMKKYKEDMMCYFLENTLQLEADIVYDVVLPVIDQAKECYDWDSEDDTFNNHDLFRSIMFVDGCFLVQFILNDVFGSKQPVKVMKMYDASWTVRDLFLLENQLPFSVIKRLMRLKGLSEDKILDIIKKFINQVRPTHLHEQTCKIKEAMWSRCFGPLKHSDWKVSGEPLHLLHVLQMQVVDYANTENAPVPKPSRHFKRGNGQYWDSYRSATALQAAGIKFRCGKSPHFNHVCFSEGAIVYGCLTLTPLTIDEMSEPTLLNLVAFEALPDAADKLVVTSYLCFLGSMIDHAEDVKVLRSKDIINNFLGSDQQVADLFNNITQGLVPDPSVFFGVEKKITRHYKKKGLIWMNQFISNRLSSPWTTLAVLGAIFAFILTVVQTYFSGVSALSPPQCVCALPHKS